MRMLFVMDPLAAITAATDTSFDLMLHAQSRGHQIDYCVPEDLALHNGSLQVRSAPVQADEAAVQPIVLGEARDVEVGDYQVVWVRTNPPFDARYLWLTLMLETVRDRVLIINDPRGLREANEKLYACLFPQLMPETLVSSSKQRIEAFIASVGGEAVIKPLDGFGGDGVFSLRASDLNFKALIDMMTVGGKRLAMVQRFMPEVRHGDKRVLLLDGEPLGGMLRRPAAEALRSNLRAGGTALASEIDAADRRIIDAIAPRLRADGLWFVGIDIIGGKLTEVNVTSPTGIRQMSRLVGAPLSVRVIEWVERRLS